MVDMRLPDEDSKFLYCIPPFVLLIHAGAELIMET